MGWGPSAIGDQAGAPSPSARLEPEPFGACLSSCPSLFGQMICFPLPPGEGGGEPHARHCPPGRDLPGLGPAPSFSAPSARPGASRFWYLTPEVGGHKHRALLILPPAQHPLSCAAMLGTRPLIPTPAWAPAPLEGSSPPPSPSLKKKKSLLPLSRISTPLPQFPPV